MLCNVWDAAHEKTKNKWDSNKKKLNIYSVEGQKPSNFLFKKKLFTPQLVVEMQNVKVFFWLTM